MADVSWKVPEAEKADHLPRLRGQLAAEMEARSHLVAEMLQRHAMRRRGQIEASNDVVEWLADAIRDEVADVQA